MVNNDSYSKLYGFIIIVYAGKFANSNRLETLKWDNLRFDLAVKYKWYFEYRTALLRVKYPKNCIVANPIFCEMTKKGTLDNIKSSLANARKNYTKNQNLLNKAVENWNSLFPIVDDVNYKKAFSKVQLLKSKVLELEIQLNDFNENLSL
jgi:hypothetical protein